ncbi:MAG: hypothetical protein HFI97_01045 [Lachnospiraceae bacterium]|nr:hypothetical protein [Lachnospiraceae bacterium]
MKIRVFLCSEDTLYCEKLVNYFNSHYYDKFQWDVYTQSVYLEQIFQAGAADLILIGEEMEADLQKLDEKLLKKQLWVYLAEYGKEQEEGTQYLEKYRRADQIYRDLLDLYAKKEHVHYENLSLVSGKTAFIVFVSAGGGIGASTIACAAAKAFSRVEKVLYLNLEDLGSCKLSFAGEDKPGLDELVYAIKSRRNTLELKIESSVSRDGRGTYYFKECANPMDLRSLSAEDVKELLRAIAVSRVYDKVIIDLGNGLQDKEIMAMSMANRVIMITDQSEISSLKLERYLKFAQTIEEIRKIDIISKMQIYFNRILKGTQLPEHISHIRVGGVFPLIENGNYAGIIERISKMELLHSMK